MTQQSYRRWCSAALLLLTLVAACCLWAISRTGLQIDTDLRSLSPSFSDDTAVNKALNKMSADAAQTFILVLVHKDERVLIDASGRLHEMIERDSGTIRYVNQRTLLDSYSALLEQHQFHLLGAQAQTALMQGDDSRVLKLGETNLYGSGERLRLLPISSDPLGFANEYALGILDHLELNGDDEVKTIVLDSEKVFIAAHMLQIGSDALEMKQQDLALNNIKQFTAELRQEYPDIDIQASGILFFAADAAQSARTDIYTISIGSLIGVLLLVLWIFRGPRALLLPALSIGMGLTFAFSLCHFWFGSIHVLTLVFGASLIGVVVDYALHFYYFHAHHPQSENRLPLYRALFLSLLTSVIGFSAIAWSGLAALQQVAIFAALGLVYAWLMVIAVGHYLAKGVRVYDSGLQKIALCLLHWCGKINSRWLVPIAALLLVAGFSIKDFELPVDDSLRSLLSSNSQLIAQEKQVSEWIASYELASFIVVHGDTAQQVYDRIDVLQQALDKDETNGVGSQLLGVQLFFPSPVQQQKNYQLNQRLYGAGALAEQFIHQHKLTGIYADELSAAYSKQKDLLLNPADFFGQSNLALPPLWIQNKQNVYAFLLIPKGLDTNVIESRADAIEGVDFFSVTEDSEESMQMLRQSAMELLFVSLILMAVLLLTRYHWKKMLQLIAVPIFAVAASFILLALLNIPLTLFHVMALFLVVGLGVDYVIFIAEMTENTVETLSAVAISSTTNLLSFGLLGLSILPAVSAFGITLFIGSSFNLIGAVLLASRESAPIENEYARVPR